MQFSPSSIFQRKAQAAEAEVNWDEYRAEEEHRERMRKQDEARHGYCRETDKHRVTRVVRGRVLFGWLTFCKSSVMLANFSADFGHALACDNHEIGSIASPNCLPLFLSHATHALVSQTFLTKSFRTKQNWADGGTTKLKSTKPGL